MNDQESAKLYQKLITYFNSSELRELAFRVGVDYDTLAGRTKYSQARELILYTQRHARTNDLLQEIAHLRPNAIGELSFFQQPELIKIPVLGTIRSGEPLSTPSAENELRLFYLQIEELQMRFQQIQDLTGLNDEETQGLLNLLEDAPHELLRDLLSRHDDPRLKQYAQEYAQMEHKLGTALVAQGKWYAGLRRFERSLTIRRLLDNLDERADTIYQIGRTYQLMGNLAEARIRYRDAMRLYRHTGNNAGIAACNLNLGTVAIQLGFMDEGIAQIQKAQIYHMQNDNEQKLQEIEEILRFVHQVKQKEPA